MLAVRVHDEPVVARARRARSRNAASRAGVASRPGAPGARRGHAEVGQVDRREPCALPSSILLSRRAASTGTADADAALDVDEPVRRRPSATGPTSPSGQVTRTWASVAGPEPHMLPAQLAADVPAAHDELRGAVAESPAWVSIDRADRVAVAARLARAGTRASRPSRAGASAVPPPTFRQTRTGAPRLASTRSSSPSWLKSASAAPRPRSNDDDARRLGALDERAVGLAEEQVARVAHRVVGHLADVALGHEQVR